MQKLPERSRSPGPSADGIRLAGEQRFVDLADAVDDVAVGDDLVALRRWRRSPWTTSSAGIRLRLAVAHDRRLRRRQGSQLAERARRPQLLERRDGDVGDNDDADEEAVLELPDREEGEDQRREDRR